MGDHDWVDDDFEGPSSARQGLLTAAILVGVCLFSLPPPVSFC